MDKKKDVIYKVVSEREIKLDIYLPEENIQNKTAVILLHGGGWRHGDKSMMDLFGPELIKHGFVVIAPEYRLLGEAPWPAQIKDVKSVICWLRVHAEEYGIDPTKIALQGFSAGGHLALLAAGTPDDVEYKDKKYADISDSVAAVVAFFPPVEFHVGPLHEGINAASMLLGENPTIEAAKEISPIHRISASFPPTLLMHGTSDKMVSHITSQRFFAALEQENVPVEMHLFSRHTHEFVRLPSMMAQTQAEIALFLNRMVVDPEMYKQENLELNSFAKV